MPSAESHMINPLRLAQWMPSERHIITEAHKKAVGAPREFFFLQLTVMVHGEEELYLRRILTLGE